MSKESVVYLLHKYQLRPNEVRGQHFLIDESVLEKILVAADCKTSDAVLEVGPGIGNLTALLAQSCRHVVAVEVDRRYKPVLDALCAVNTNVTVLYHDILTLSFEELIKAFGARTEYKIVANIPYYLTSRLLAQFIQYPVLPQVIVVLVQKEVADRIVEGPGNHSKLSLGIQFYAEPRVVFRVPRDLFYPKPAVDSAVVQIKNLHRWSYPESEQRVWQLINFGFSAKRKKLVNNLAAGLHVDRETIVQRMGEAGIDPSKRAQMLSAGDWRSLARVF